MNWMHMRPIAINEMIINSDTWFIISSRKTNYSIGIMFKTCVFNIKMELFTSEKMYANKPTQM